MQKQKLKHPTEVGVWTTHKKERSETYTLEAEEYWSKLHYVHMIKPNSFQMDIDSFQIVVQRTHLFMLNSYLVTMETTSGVPCLYTTIAADFNSIKSQWHVVREHFRREAYSGRGCFSKKWLTYCTQHILLSFSWPFPEQAFTMHWCSTLDTRHRLHSHFQSLPSLMAIV